MLPLYREPKMPRNLEDRAVEQLVPCQFRHSTKSWCPNDLLLSSGYTAAGAAVRIDWMLTAEDVQLRAGDIFSSNRILAFKSTQGVLNEGTSKDRTESRAKPTASSTAGCLAC